MTTCQRILVTGARGFLGSHIVARARADGQDVVAAYRGASQGATAHLDVCDAKSVDAAFRTSVPSLVIHCAAYGLNYADQDLARALAVNAEGSLHVLAAAAHYGVRRFVHVGTCFEYGSRAGPIVEDAPLKPTSIYGATKAAATILLRERAAAHGVPLVIARPFGIWGPGDAPHHLIPQVVAACMSGSLLKLTPCEMVRDYTYVEDMAARLLSLGLNEELLPGEIVNVASGQSILLRDFILSIASLLGGEHLMKFGALAYRSTEMPSLVADVRRMHQVLGTGPRTPLAEGVQRMVAALTNDRKGADATSLSSTQ